MRGEGYEMRVGEWRGVGRRSREEEEKVEKRKEEEKEKKEKVADTIVCSCIFDDLKKKSSWTLTTLKAIQLAFV
jgi:hypothetical protein